MRWDEFYIRKSFFNVKLSMLMFVSPFWNKSGRGLFVSDHSKKPGDGSYCAISTCTRITRCTGISGGNRSLSTKPSPCSPDFSLCEYFPFAKLKLLLKGRFVSKTLKTYERMWQQLLPRHQISLSFRWVIVPLLVLTEEECTSNKRNSPNSAAFPFFFL